MSGILIALFLGFIFGFLLNKGDVGNFNTIVGQLLFRNLTVLNIMMTAIVVGGFVLYSLVDIGVFTQLPAKASGIKSSAIGGVIFGIGMGLLGYCPGTMLAAVGKGARDAWFGIAGGIVGGVLFLYYGSAVKQLLGVDEPTALTVSDYVGISPYVVFILLASATVCINIMYQRMAMTGKNY